MSDAAYYFCLQSFKCHFFLFSLFCLRTDSESNVTDFPLVVGLVELLVVLIWTFKTTQRIELFSIVRQLDTFLPKLLYLQKMCKKRADVVSFHNLLLLRQTRVLSTDKFPRG